MCDVQEAAELLHDTAVYRRRPLKAELVDAIDVMLELVEAANDICLE